MADAIAARVAQLEGALEKVVTIAHDYRIYDIETVAKAGLDCTVASEARRWANEFQQLAIKYDLLVSALEPTAENIGAYYNVPANVSGSAWDDIVAVLAAIRSRAGLGGKEGNRG